MKNKTFLQRFFSFALGLMAICLGMLAAVSTSAWYPRTSQEIEGKAFQKPLPILPEPVKLLEIKTATQSFRFPDELLLLTGPAANRGIPNKNDKWSIDLPTEARFKEAPAFRIKDISTSGPYRSNPYVEVQVADTEDWLRGAAFRLRNDSGKDIHHLTLKLSFPETTSSGPVMAYPISLGRIPNVVDDQREPFFVKPDEELVIEINDKIYNGIVKFLAKRHAISSINRAEIRLQLIAFDDGIAWGDGEYLRQDPDNPRSFTPIGVNPPKQ